MKQHTLIPSLTEIAGLSTVSVAILSALTIAPIVRNINASSYSFFSGTVSAYIMEQLDKLNTPRATAILTFLLWCVVGALAYVLLWSIGSLIKSFKEDVSPFSGLIVPAGYLTKLSLATHITRIYIRAVALLGLIFWTVFFFAEVLPFSVNQLVTSLIRIDGLSVVAIFLAIFYVAGGLYLFSVLIRLILLRRRVFSS